MAGLPDPDITVRVEESLQPFAHVQQQARDNFAADMDEDLLELMDETNELKRLGPHPILAIQTCEDPPPRWVHAQFEAERDETIESVRLVLRNENLYVRGVFNQHNRLELSQRVRETDRNLPRLLPLEYNSVLVDWDYSYSSLFGVDSNAELEVILRDIINDPRFGKEAVIFLSRYRHGAGASEEEAKNLEKLAKWFLGCLIFLFCERTRMNIPTNHLGSLIDTVQLWGDISLELRKWKAKDFNDGEWCASEKLGPWGTRTTRKIRDLGIELPRNALQRLYLVLNGKLDKSLRKNRRGGDGGGGDDGGEDHGNNEKTPSKNGEESGKPGDGKGGGDGGWEDPMEVDGPESGHGVPYGRRRIQIVDVYANFSIDSINFLDWRRPLGIYRKELIDDSEQDGMIELGLVGPVRAIGAYGVLGIENFPTLKRSKRMKTSNEFGSFKYHWYDDCEKDEVTSHEREISLSRDEKVKIRYLLIPDAMEVRFSVALLLGRPGQRGGYHVGGIIKVWVEDMDDSCKIFSKETVLVSCRVKSQLPLVPLVCLPYRKDLKVKADIHLSLVPSTPNDEEEELSFAGPFCLTLIPWDTREYESNGHRLEIGMHVRT